MSVEQLETGSIHPVASMSVGELLANADRLLVPSYQRPYSWTPETALRLLEDLLGAHRGEDAGEYVLGSVILHSETGFPDANADIVDGQQRIISLSLLCALLEDVDPTAAAGESSAPIVQVKRALARRICGMTVEEREALAGYIRDRVVVVVVQTRDLDEAFRMFDSQNYRGKPLRPHDLLKAYHLREMRDERPAVRVAAVERWQQADDEDLDRLFSDYLYRIHCWSRGHEAPGFTAQEIGVFKGASLRGNTAPTARYHHAAQAFLPALDRCDVTKPVDEQARSRESRDALRAQFQLDAPVTAGATFFDMIAFMLDEVQSLVSDAFDETTRSFSSVAPTSGAQGRRLSDVPHRSRYRYVTDLYLCALLYYSNKFSTIDLETVRPLIFEWAYSLRLRLHSVQYRSVDKHARGDGHGEVNLFQVIREDLDGSALRSLDFASWFDPEERRDGHEDGLARAIKAVAP